MRRLWQQGGGWWLGGGARWGWWRKGVVRGEEGDLGEEGVGGEDE